MSNSTTEGEGDPLDEKLDPRVYPIVVSSFMTGTAIGIVLPVMPLFASQLGITTAQLGLAGALLGGSRLLCNIPSAWLADRFGRRCVLIGGPSIGALGMTLNSMITNASELMASRSLSGIGGSLQMTGGQLYLADISKPANRARTLAPLNTAFSAGAAIGPALGGFLTDAFGMRSALLVVGSAMGVIAIVNSLMLPETRPARARLAGPAAVPASSMSGMWKDFVQAARKMWPLLRDPQMRAVMLVQTSYWLAMSGCMFTLLPLLATEQLGLSALTLGYCMGVMPTVAFLTTQLAAKFNDRFGRKMAIVPGMMLLATSLAMFPFADSLPQLVGLITLSALGSSLTASAPSAFLTDITTPETRAQGFALYRSSSDFGLLLGGVMLGTIAHIASIPSSFFVASAIVSTCGLYFGLRAVETVRRFKPTTTPAKPATNTTATTDGSKPNDHQH